MFDVSLVAKLARCPHPAMMPACPLPNSCNSPFASLAAATARHSPNPMVGAVLVKRGKIIGQGWHHRAGLPHAEIEALQDATRHGHNPKGATLYVTLEPCSTHGRTPPCCDAITAAKVKRVVIETCRPQPPPPATSGQNHKTRPHRRISL